MLDEDVKTNWEIRGQPYNKQICDKSEYSLCVGKIEQLENSLSCDSSTNTYVSILKELLLQVEFY